MKTKYHLSLIILALIAIAGCKKDDLEYTSYDPDKIVPKYLIRSIHTVNGLTDITEYSYDDKKRLSTIKIGKLTFTYSYSGNTLISIGSKLIDGSLNVGNLYEYTYDNGVLASTTRKMYTNDVVVQQYTFTHTITRSEVMETVKQPGAERTQLTFANGNVTSFANDSTKVNYTYDGQRSIFTNAPAAYPFLGDIADRFSKNNLIKKTNADGVTVNYTYTYDADGYPIALLTDKERYTYVYVTL